MSEPLIAFINRENERRSRGYRTKQNDEAARRLFDAWLSEDGVTARSDGESQDDQDEAPE